MEMSVFVGTKLPKQSNDSAEIMRNTMKNAAKEFNVTPWQVAKLAVKAAGVAANAQSTAAKAPYTLAKAAAKAMANGK
jgi:formiminotetrahydrofolate cyclodeaminase